MKEGRFKSLSIQEARQLADEWIRKLSQCCCQRVDVVAGVYRGKSPTSDVDLICLPKDGTLQPLRDLNPVKEDSVRMVFDDAGRKVEVWKAENPASYELKRWYRRTSPAEFIKLAKRARARGMRLSWRDGLLDGDGKTITKDPSEIVSMLSDDHG